MIVPSRRPLWLAVLVLLCAIAMSAAAATPPGVTVLRDVAYGPAALQTMDVYLPAQPKSAPIILMVHGGAWAEPGRSATSAIRRWWTTSSRAGRRADSSSSR
jgi:acetyl esterase/lipase